MYPTDGDPRWLYFRARRSSVITMREKDEQPDSLQAAVLIYRVCCCTFATAASLISEFKRRCHPCTYISRERGLNENKYIYIHIYLCRSVTQM
jgi:hypothetical protein